MVCISCKNTIIGNPGRVLGGKLKKVWCGSGTYATKTRYECSPCWEAYKKQHEAAFDAFKAQNESLRKAVQP